jgi:hypothetical protein
MSVEALAAYILDVDADEHWDDLNALLRVKYQIDLDTFEAIVNKLIPVACTATSPVSGKVYQGFYDPERDIWMVKKTLRTASDINLCVSLCDRR